MTDPFQMINLTTSSGTTDTLGPEKKDVAKSNTTLSFSYSCTNPGLQLSASLSLDLVPVSKLTLVAFGGASVLLLLLLKVPPETAKTALELLVYACKLMLGNQ